MVDGAKKKLSELKEKVDAEAPVVQEKARAGLVQLKETSRARASELSDMAKTYQASSVAVWHAWRDPAAVGDGSGGGGGGGGGGGEASAERGGAEGSAWGEDVAGKDVPPPDDAPPPEAAIAPGPMVV